MSESETPAHSSGTVYTIETLEKITRLSKDQIVLYYEYGLVSTTPASGKTDLLFDDEAIHKLRRIAFLLSEYEVNHRGLRKIVALMDELEKLREELRFLRGR